MSGDEATMLTEDELRALRGSKFAPLPSSSLTLPSSFSPLPLSSSQEPRHHHHQQKHKQPRLAHPGGPMTTNKAAALAKFLKRKMQQPEGLSSINPELLELAIKNAKEAVYANGTSGRIVRHVDSFNDSSNEEQEEETRKPKWKKKKKKKKKKKREKCVEVGDMKDTKKKKTELDS